MGRLVRRSPLNDGTLGGRKRGLHCSSEPPLEVLFGAASADHIRVEVLGPTCLGADTDWYRSQLNATIHVHIGSFRGRRSLVMFTDNFHLFGDDLSKLEAGTAGVAWLQTGDFLSVDVEAAERVLRVRLQLDVLEAGGSFLEHDGGNANWEWHLQMDRADLEALIKSVAQIRERYPLSSTP